MIDKAIRALMTKSAGEKIASDEMEITSACKRKNIFQQKRIADLNAIGASGKLEKIIAAEKFLVDFDLKENANSTSMVSSLKTAQKELEAIENNIGLVGNSTKYKSIDTSNSQPKTRDSHDLPKDGARIAFSSHIARLENYNKAKSDNNEKTIIQARLQNILIAEKLYIGRQEKALGREPGRTIRENN